MSHKTTNAAVTGAKTNTGKRKNILLPQDTESKASALAALEKRSFTNLLEVLIDREFERQGLNRKEQELQEVGK